MSDEIVEKLQAAYEAQGAEWVHSIAISMATFITEVVVERPNWTSQEVADYIERRLQPLVGLERFDIRCQRALVQIRDDSRAALAAIAAARKETP